MFNVFSPTALVGKQLKIYSIDKVGRVAVVKRVVLDTYGKILYIVSEKDEYFNMINVIYVQIEERTDV